MYLRHFLRQVFKTFWVDIAINHNFHLLLVFLLQVIITIRVIIISSKSKMVCRIKHFSTQMRNASFDMLSDSLFSISEASWGQYYLFKGVSFDDDWKVAQGCWRYIRGIFTQLEEFRSFELLRSGRDRTDYLLVILIAYSALIKKKKNVGDQFRRSVILYWHEFDSVRWSRCCKQIHLSVTYCWNELDS